MAALLVACGEHDDARPNLDASVLDATLDGSPTPEQRASLDVLFVIDNSGSMGSKQEALARELPWFIEQLLLEASSLHVGVVTSNAGGVDPREQDVSEPVKQCYGVGDDGLLQTRVDVARDGYTRYPGFNEFGDPQVVIQADPACALGVQPRYQQFTPGQGDAVGLSCVARPGVLGCPLEQQLESMWKALAPSARASASELYRFVGVDGGQSGQGDRGNQGFLREHAALAVIVLSDEDDCSVTSEGRGLLSLSQQAEERYGSINLRCGTQEALLQPIERYRDGLRALKPAHPERVVFTAIAGMPISAIGLDPAAVLELDAMQFAEDPQNPTFSTPVCELSNGDQVLPGIRFVRLAQAFGAQSVLGSLCGDDYRGALERTVAKLIPLLQ